MNLVTALALIFLSLMVFALIEHQLKWPSKHLRRVWRYITKADAKEAEALRQRYMKRTGRSTMRALPDGVRSRTLFGPDGTKETL